MKRMILVTLCAVMLFVAGTPVTARAACDGGSHPYEITGEYWEPTGQGFQHSYTGYDGITRGCSVNIMRKIVVKYCPVCGTTTHMQTGYEEERHSSCGSK